MRPRLAADKNGTVDLPSGTATFLFTDIEGSTALLHRLGTNLYAEVLAEHHRIIRTALAAHGGTEIGTQGDGFFAVFSSPSSCAAAAIDVQRSLGETSWPAGETVKVRMGIHVGEAAETPSGPVGFDVHRAARVAAVAHGGQVVISETAASLLRDSLPEGASLQDLGHHRLKDLGRPEHIFQLAAQGMETEFPALRSLDNPELEHNLPIQLTSFVGREKEVLEVCDLIAETRLLTLAGPAGSGKTRLALQVAAEVLDGTGDGVWLVDLSALNNEEQVAREVAVVLGVREESNRDLLETLVDALQYRRLLLVLDNCEHLVDAVAKLAETIVRQCQNVSVLTTSREPLAVAGERVFRVPPLGLPADTEPTPEEVADSEAVRLFVERSKQHRPDFTMSAANAKTIASVCRHLDGMPLALELAAARIRSMSLEEVERHLGQRFKLLSSRSRTGAARQQTLEAAVAWSYELLNESERLLFTNLSIFPSSFDLSAAKSVGSATGKIDEFEVVDLLESLVDKSLVQTEQGATDLRYRMLESIAHYASDRLNELGTEALLRARESHAAYYLQFAEEAVPKLQGPDQAEWMDRMDADLDNFRTAAWFLSNHAEDGMAPLRMVAALRTYWERSGWNPGEAIELARAVLAQPGTQRRSSERAQALIALGISFENLGDASASRAAHEEGSSIAKEIGDLGLLVDHLAYLSFQLYRMGEFDSCKEVADEALRLATEVGDAALLGRCHERVAIADSFINADSARAHFASAIRFLERLGDRWRLCRTYNNLASVEMQTGNLAGARASLDAALEYAVTPAVRGVVLLNASTIDILEDDIANADSKSREALRQLVRVGLWGHVPYAVLDVAICESSIGRLIPSALLHGAADAMMEQNGVPWEVTEATLRERSIDALRQQLGEASFESNYRQGHEMHRPDVITLALGKDEPGPAGAL